MPAMEREMTQEPRKVMIPLLNRTKTDDLGRVGWARGGERGALRKQYGGNGIYWLGLDIQYVNVPCVYTVSL